MAGQPLQRGGSILSLLTSPFCTQTFHLNHLGAVSLSLIAYSLGGSVCHCIQVSVERLFNLSI